MKPILLFFALLCLSSSALHGQTAGGKDITVYTIPGGFEPGRYSANFLASLGDVNADGTPDFLSCTDSDFGVEAAVKVFSGTNGSLLHEWTHHEKRMAASDIGDLDLDGHADILVGLPPVPGTQGVITAYSGATGLPIRHWNLSLDSVEIWLANIGDTNSDGVNDFVVGLGDASVSGINNSGVVLVFSGATSAQLLRMDGWNTKQNLGTRVAGAGDVNADGIGDLLVYAQMKPGNKGAAYVFSGVDGQMLHEWIGANPDDYNGFGMAAAGDVNQDGFDDVYVTSYSHSSAGVVYLYSGATGMLIQRWNGSMNGERFGYSIDTVGDFNQDGVDDFAVGASRSTSLESYAGAGYVISGLDGGILQVYQGTQDYGYLGYGVAGIGDINGNGTPDIAFGVGRTGNVKVFDALIHNPLILGNLDTISASTGGTFALGMDFQQEFAGRNYQIMLSGTGSHAFFENVGPGIAGIWIPLTQDQLFLDSAYQRYPVPAIGMSGQLNASGKATASFPVPGGLPVSLIGRELFFAAVVFDGMGPNRSSAAVFFEVVP